MSRIIAIGLCCLACMAHAQQAVVGTLDYGAREARRDLWQAFEEKLRELGHVEGRNVAFERRWGDGSAQRVSALAGELAARKVALIVASGTVASAAAVKATTSVPVVFMAAADPVEAGLVASLAHPGRNATGLTSLSSDLSAKRLAMLRDALPRVQRVAVLYDTTNVAGKATARELEAAASALGLKAQAIGAGGPKDFEGAFRAMKAAGVDAVVVTSSAMFFTHRARLASLAIEQRLPASFATPEYAEAGGLFAYGVDLKEQHRQAAVLADKILRGANPGDIAVERAARFELVVNLKTARAIGLSIPPALLARADTVID